MSADWLADTVLYEIYPQSFADSDGDGIGDLRGVIEHLDDRRDLAEGAPVDGCHLPRHRHRPRGPRTDQPPTFADSFLVIMAEHASLFDNHAAGILPFQPPVEPFFDAEGRGSTQLFLHGWDDALTADPDRLVILSSADHGFNRLACGPRTPEQLGAALTFLLTWGSVPCLYYGDEIGMRYLPNLPDVEGAVCSPSYNRAGCRTPMQWDATPQRRLLHRSPLTALPPRRS